MFRPPLIDAESAPGWLKVANQGAKLRWDLIVEKWVVLDSERGGIFRHPCPRRLIKNE